MNNCKIVVQVIDRMGKNDDDDVNDGGSGGSSSIDCVFLVCRERIDEERLFLGCLSGLSVVFSGLGLENFVRRSMNDERGSQSGLSNDVFGFGFHLHPTTCDTVV